MSNKLSICKSAVLLAGMEPIESLDDGTIESIQASQRFESLFERLLSETYWTFSLKQAKLNKSSEEGEFTFKNKFFLPSDYIRLNRFLSNDDFENPREFRIVGNQIYTNVDKLAVEYVAKVSSDLLPNYLKIYLEYELASELCLALTEDPQKAQLLAGKSMQYLYSAKTFDAMGTQQKSMWNSNYLNIRGGY